MFTYKPTKTGLAFHNSTKFMKLIVGPYGSGKSCALANEILFNAMAQNAASDGVRYCRVGVIRSSYPELISATRKSLIEVMPPQCGTVLSSGSPMTGLYNIPLPDGTVVRLELELWAIANEDDNEKIKSCNWTFAAVNEATGCHPTVIPAIMSRIGRFPSAENGGITWSGILMDTNQPPPGSWLEDFVRNPQENWDVFIQPPAAFKREGPDGNMQYEMNPDAENLENLGSFNADDPPGFTAVDKGMRYYRNQIEPLVKLRRFDIVDNQYCLLSVPIVDGKPVYPSFERGRHVARRPLEPVPFRDIIVGMDQSGIHPAAIVAQFQNERWCVLDELYAENEGFENFLYGMLVPLLRQKYSTCPVIAVIDPSNTRDSWQAITPSERLETLGIMTVADLTNNPKLRIQTVEHMLNLHTGGLLISPSCELLIRGFESEYRYRRLRAGGTMGAVYTPQPEKNDASHPQDALQYFALYIMREQQLADDGRSQGYADAMSRHRQRLMKVV